MNISKATASTQIQKGLSVSFPFYAYTHTFFLVLDFRLSIAGAMFVLSEGQFTLFHPGQ